MLDPETRAEVSGDELVRRVKVALAEMGYSDRFVREATPSPDGLPDVGISPPVPPAIAWQALFMAFGTPEPCWTCWLDQWEHDGHAADRCMTGDCANLGPKRPPRELLVSS